MVWIVTALSLCRPCEAARKRADPRAPLGGKALEELYRAMASEDPEVRALAAREWGEIGNQAAAPLLKGALRDANRHVRIAACWSLFQLGNRSGEAALEALVRERASVKEGAASDPVEQLKAMARGKVRAEALRTLARMGSIRSIQALREAARDSSGEVRDAATAALARLGEPEALSGFLKAAESEDAEERLAAARRLGEIALPETSPALRRMAQDSSYAVRAAAMQGLGALGEGDALRELEEGARDQNELVRSKAVEALGRLGSPAAAASLREAYEQSSNVYLQLLAIVGLARLGQEVELGVAQRSLSQPDSDTKLLAVEALEAAGGERAIEVLEFALRDAEPRVRVRTAAALVKLLKK